MIGRIEITKDVQHLPNDWRERSMEIVWDTNTIEPPGSTIQTKQPDRSILPGIYGAVGDTVEVTVRVIPKESEETDGK